MTAPRLASSVLVSSLLRLVEREGGFGAVLAKGDGNAGAILIILAERGRRMQVLERLLQPNGSYAWGSPLKVGANDSDIDRFLEKRQRFDADSWLIELDTASAQRLADEIRSFD